MIVEDFEKLSNIRNMTELEHVLMKRYGNNVNSFWLYHGPGKFPDMHLMVNGEHACLYYFSREGDPGSRSVGKLDGLKAGGNSIFCMDGIEQKVEILNDAVIPLADALIAAKEFFISRNKPKSIEWFQL